MIRKASNHKISTNIYYIFCLLAGTLFTACNQNKGSENGQTQQMPEQQKVIIKDKKGNHLVRFAWSGQHMRIKTSRQEWQKTVSTDLPENITYTGQQNQTLLWLKVKGLDFSIKTLQAPGKQWRLRFLGDTMHIFKTNLENSAKLNNASLSVYKVVQYKLNKYRVYNAHHQIGKTKITSGIVDVDGHGIDLKIPAKTNSYAYTLLMMFDLPEAIRFTLMGELLAKGL